MAQDRWDAAQIRTANRIALTKLDAANPTATAGVLPCRLEPVCRTSECPRGVPNGAVSVGGMHKVSLVQLCLLGGCFLRSPGQG